MKALLEPLNELESFRLLADGVRNGRTPALATGVIDAQKCHLAYGLMARLNRPALIITHGERRAKEIYEDMQFFLKGRAKLYPAKDMIFYAADVKSADIVRQRFHVIDSLLRGESPTIVLSVEALFDRLTRREVFQQFILSLQPGDEVSLDVLSKRLVYMGYERTELVEGPGQFAIRGGIMDIYTTIYENALRIEFFGDEVDSIRLLDAYTQRSIEKMNHVRIYPMREMVYGEAELQKAIAAIRKEYEASSKKMTKKGLIEEQKRLSDTFGHALEQLQEQKTFPGVEKFAHYFYDDEISLLDYLRQDTLIFVDEPVRVSQHADTVRFEFEESMKNRILKGDLLPSQMDMVFSYAQILRRAQLFQTVLFTTLTQTVKDFSVKTVTSFAVKSSVILKHDIELLTEDLKYWCANGYRVLILAGAKLRGQRLAELLAEHDLPVSFLESLQESTLAGGRVTVGRGSLSKGFEYPLIRLAVVSEKELFGGEKEKKRRRKQTKGDVIQSFTDLRIGDYVVHDNHGVGIYRGIEKIVVDNVSRDYLKLSYADGGHLYVQTGQMDMIQKYIGGEGARIKLNKLGGADWSRAKTRARKAVAILAQDLVELYARRQASKGFAYSVDTVWQREFEEIFPFEETEDQLTAIEEVKRDMESGRVMDRLICGDVGYGKTEVAIRAAFKAVQDGKQVAYLVPTTILAQQHYNTFIQRMKDYPIGIEMLSRFRTAKQQKESIEKLAKGSSDIVIGTHRILSKDIRFKDLGMVIVDEEQRFGVGHKEKLKQLSENVAVLTLTATPIPRTLHMSLTGIRDMSVLEEPPQERQPVQTYVMEHNPDFVRDAIQRELARDGQVYYLHNRVRNIMEEANRVQKLVPDAAVAFAHGQMSERELENIMRDFIEGAIQVLVCTTIIETGLDISNVNTIIIQDADYMGLSQLYQLRGRVGRSNRLAYAYLMYRKDKVLDEVAEKRLQTVKEFTEFGAGFKIAMRDLEIRGAGNLLGAEQHGHMDAVGYEMYCKLLSDAVAELKGEERAVEFETFIDININAYISPDYIPNEEQKLEIYKKISLINSQEDYYDIQEEIEDRYGDIPLHVKNLLDIALLKADAHRVGVLSIVQKQRNAVIAFKPDAPADPLKIAEMVGTYRNRLFFTVGQNPYLTYKLPEGDNQAVTELRTIINGIHM